MQRVELTTPSFFGDQQGLFDLTIHSISAVTSPIEPAIAIKPERPLRDDEKGVLGWLFGSCTVS